jgi:hypothetical protein
VWQIVATSRVGGRPCPESRHMTLAFHCLYTTVQQLLSSSVNIHAILGGGGPRQQPLNVAVNTSSREILASSNNDGGIQLRPDIGGSSPSLQTVSGGMVIMATIQCWILNFVILYTRTLPSSPQLLPSTTTCTPDHSSPPPAPSSCSSPSSSPELPSPPHPVVEAISAIASPAPSHQSSSPTPVSTGPPTPPPWPEAYVFSTDPDRIVCRKCCNRHYNFRWYIHCFMCNRP